MRNGALRFGVVGVDHTHILGMVDGLHAAGAECAGAFGGGDADQIAAFTRTFPDITVVDDPRRLYDDAAIDVIATAAVAADRADIAVDAMRAGKDVLADKPAATTLDQLGTLRAAVSDTGRIWVPFFGERFTSPSTVRAAELVRSGAIGDVVQTIGLGPHRLRRSTRAPWFFQRDRYGGILTDIASHQMDQFLYLTGSHSAEVVAASVGNHANPADPGLQDFGEALLRSDRAHGYVRVDWYTPDGLSSWGDGRITILGTSGYIELRKNVDIAGRSGGEHLFLVDRDGEQHMDCAGQPVTFFADFLADVRDRTETANAREMSFTAMELALTAQLTAERTAASTL